MARDKRLMGREIVLNIREPEVKNSYLFNCILLDLTHDRFECTGASHVLAAVAEIHPTEKSLRRQAVDASHIV